MPGYFGTEIQQRLQAQAEASAEFINATPGACQAGRIMSCDDPDRLGWDQIDAFLERDGVFGFRLIPAGKADGIKAQLAERDCRFDTWDVFLADRASALSASEAILSRSLPDGLSDLARPTDPEGEFTGRIQALMAAAGIVPFSGSMLTGAFGPAATVAVGDEDGNIAAAAHGYMPHNAFSDFHRHAWGGLVAVAEAQRGKGLGTYINAMMIVSAFRELGATHIYELVSAANIPSRRMVEACGLRREPALVAGMATPNGNTRFTR
jgi:RimJ/RimL family protein N-acetyltransferase